MDKQETAKPNIAKRIPRRHQPKGMRILHDDRDIVVVEKPAGLLTVGTDRIKEETAYYRLTDYVRKGNAKSRDRVFVVHRLDRDVSGVLVFAKTPHAKKVLQDDWDKAEKKYFAVVHGFPAVPSGIIESYLTESKIHHVESTEDARRGKWSRTAYCVMKSTAAYSLLEIDLLTGRKHQIRVHLAEARHPIVGDKKYGEDAGAESRLALHAKTLVIQHPRSGERMVFDTEMPEHFSIIMARRAAPKKEPARSRLTGKDSEDRPGRPKPKRKPRPKGKAKNKPKAANTKPGKSIPAEGSREPGPRRPGGGKNRGPHR